MIAPLTELATVPAPVLARRLTLRDMVLLNIVAVIRLRMGGALLFVLAGIGLYTRRHRAVAVAA